MPRDEDDMTRKEMEDRYVDERESVDFLLDDNIEDSEKSLSPISLAILLGVVVVLFLLLRILLR